MGSVSVWPCINQILLLMPVCLPSRRAAVWSWCAVVQEHGVPPAREPGQIYVANHTSVIDITRQSCCVGAGGIGRAHV